MVSIAYCKTCLVAFGTGMYQVMMGIFVRISVAPAKNQPAGWCLRADIRFSRGET